MTRSSSEPDRATPSPSSGALISIIVRTKDRPHLLRRALQSITAQTLTDWECVLINDGGDSAAVDQVIDELTPECQARVRVVHHTEARGRWKSANAGVLASSAALLVLHDDDDTWHPEFLQHALAYLDSNVHRAGVVARTEIVWESPNIVNGGSSGFEIVDRELFQGHLHDLLLSDALLFNRYVPIGFVYRRALHTDLGLYQDELPVVGDWAFNLKVLSRGPLEYLGDAPLAYWHQRVDSHGADSNSVIGASRDHDKYDALIRDEYLREYVSENGIGPLLYLTKFIDVRLAQVEAGIREEIRSKGIVERTTTRVRTMFRK